jgi:hypothetical protein
MYNKALLAQHNVESAQQASKRVKQKLLEDEAANRLAVERFFNTLALVAGGTLALSVTYLGYLKTAGGHPAHLWALKASWVLLLCSLACSVFYNYLYPRYVGHGRMREYSESMMALRKASIEGADHLPVIDDEGKPWDREELKRTFTNEMNSFDRAARWNRTRENVYSRLYDWDARVAQAAFVLGLALLLVFAFLNT